MRSVHPGTREGFILVLATPPKTTDRLAELADFLRARRAALQPDDVGLAGGGRRRTPGLRREEVAALAGVGATWYTWLEQGRDVRASLDVLEAISTALRLTPAERAHLILLGRGEQAPPCQPPVERVSAELRRLVRNLGPGPAFIVGRRYDYLVWNEATAALFGDPGQLPKPTRNHAWQMFMDPARRALIVNWERSARLLVAKLRGDYARHIGDAAFDELIETLNDVSPEFRKLWARHEVSQLGEGRKLFDHPVAGRMVFDHAVFRGIEDPEQRLILYSPSCDEDTPAKLAELLVAAEEVKPGDRPGAARQ
jgi:transcriptional regulator with XRE-family HTH domain